MNKERFKEVISEIISEKSGHLLIQQDLKLVSEIVNHPEVKKMLESKPVKNKSVNLMPQTEQTKGDYHEGLQEGIAIGRRGTLKSSEGFNIVDFCKEIFKENSELIFEAFNPREGTQMLTVEKFESTVKHVVDELLKFNNYDWIKITETAKERLLSRRVNQLQTYLEIAKSNEKNKSYTAIYDVLLEEAKAISGVLDNDTNHITQTWISKNITPTTETASEWEKWSDKFKEPTSTNKHCLIDVFYTDKFNYVRRGSFQQGDGTFRDDFGENINSIVVKWMYDKKPTPPTQDNEGEG